MRPATMIMDLARSAGRSDRLIRVEEIACQESSSHRAALSLFVAVRQIGELMGPSDRLAGVFRKALELGDAVEVEELTYRGVPAWDSLGHMALVAAIEEEFGVELDSDQVIDMASFPIAHKMLRDMGVDD